MKPVFEPRLWPKHRGRKPLISKGRGPSSKPSTELDWNNNDSDRNNWLPPPLSSNLTKIELKLLPMLD
jgi:hypothetical protein